MEEERTSTLATSMSGPGTMNENFNHLNHLYGYILKILKTLHRKLCLMRVFWLSENFNMPHIEYYDSGERIQGHEGKGKILHV